MDLLVELADFILKAIMMYIATPEGGKEWGDVVKAADEAWNKSGVAK